MKILRSASTPVPARTATLTGLVPAEAPGLVPTGAPEPRGVAVARQADLPGTRAEK